MYTSTAKPVKKPSTANLGSSNLGTSTATAKKKVEGYDLGRSRPDALARSKLDGTKASNIGSNFNQNVERLKNTNAQQVEEEYIGALQEEIKILEYQMKILKDKEIEQQAAVSQIDKFFSDGVPLNDNILALKTQYQNRKADAERLLELTRRQLILVEKEISDLRAEIEVYKNQTKQIEVEHAKRDVDYKKIIDE
jgi:hypothetical protein